jgi:ketosteroid isomerase-like protein
VSQATEARDTGRRWTVDSFAAFWSNPDPSQVAGVLTDDVVGHWPGRDEPVRGPEAYIECIAALVEALPDVRLSVAEHAENGEHVFVRWIMRATGEHGPFEHHGIDRLRLRDGLVAENVIVTDTAAFEARSGRPLPWA